VDLLRLINEELRGQFLAPLFHQVSWNYNRHIVIPWIINQVLANEHAGFDGLTQANFVGENVPLDRITKHAPNDRHLMLDQLD
jgi:hypothetical protein